MPIKDKDITALQKTLDQPLAPEEILGLLRKDVDLTEADLSRLLSVSDRSVRRWMTDFKGDSSARELLLDVSDVVKLLADTGLPEPNIKSWLFRRNRFLDQARPIDTFHEDSEAVLSAANALIDGVYA